jgi:hypothetical protein
MATLKVPITFDTKKKIRIPPLSITCIKRFAIHLKLTQNGVYLTIRLSVILKFRPGARRQLPPLPNLVINVCLQKRGPNADQMRTKCGPNADQMRTNCGREPFQLVCPTIRSAGLLRYCF